MCRRTRASASGRLHRLLPALFLIALSSPGLVTHASGAAPAARAPGTQSLHVEVFIDGHSTNLVAQVFRDAEGRFSATRGELKEISVAVPGSGSQKDIVFFDTIPGLGMRYDEAAQKLHLTLAPESRLAKEYSAGASNLVLGPKVEPSKEFGAVVNYNAYGTATRGFSADKKIYQTGSLSLDGRIFSPFGTIQNSGIAGTTLTKQGFLRLDSSVVFAHRETANIVTIGDSISGGLNWTRPIRHGGFQLSRDFSLRSDIVTAPLPSVGGSAAVPSTVDVYIDNVRIASQDIGAGPYRLTNLPVSGESGTARVVVRDVTGKETVSSLPFFTSSRLLAPGKFDYSLDIGAPRHNYAIKSFDYDRTVMGMGSLRYGLSDRITLEAHAEGTKGLANGSLGATFSAGQFGLFTLVGGASWHRNNMGGLAYASWNKTLWGVSVNLSTQRTFGKFEDVASVTARPTPAPASGDLADSGFYLLSRSPKVPKAVDRISLGYPIAKWNGTLSLNFVNVERADGDKSRLASVNYSQTFAKKYNAYIGGFIDLADRRTAGITAGLSFTLGDDIIISTNTARERNGRAASFEALKPLGQKEHDYGWRLFDQEGTTSLRGATGAYRSPWARLEAGVRQDRNHLGGHAEIDGALILSPNGGIHAAPRVSDSFAIVDAGAPGVEVLHENRVIGKTGWRGTLVVPDLRSYQRSKIALNAESVPGDKLINLTDTEVMPGYRGSVSVSAKAMSVKDTARVTILDAHGAPFPPGFRVEHKEAEKTYTIGYGGIVYVPQVAEENTLVVLHGASRCSVRFLASERTGPRGLVGPLACKPE